MIFKNARNDIAVLVADAPDSVALVTRAGFATWGLHNFTRGEFTRTWRQWDPVVQPIGAPEPVPVSPVDTLRKIIRGPIPGIIPQFDPGVLDALALRFPEGTVCYFDTYDGFVHRFAEADDARLLAMRRGGMPIMFKDEVELGKLPHEQLAAVAAALDAEAPPAKPKTTYLKELFEMAKNAKAKQKKKVATVQAKAKRADGPVARARALFEKAADPKDTTAILEACAKAGITSATAKTQLYQWRKEKGIKAERGRPKEKKSATPKAAGKKAKKGKKGDEPAGTSVKEQAAASEAKATTKKKRVVVKKGQDPKAAHAAAAEKEKVNSVPPVQEETGNTPDQQIKDAGSNVSEAVNESRDAQGD